MDATTDESALGPGWVIEPRQEGFVARLRDMWRYRRLLLFFAQKAFQKLYGRTVLGRSWILIRPLLPLFVSTAVFGSVLEVGSQGMPYSLFVAVGMAPWDLFAQACTWGTRSLDMNRGFLTRIYIPRLILPLAAMSPALLNFVIHLGIILVIVGYYWFKTGALYLTPLGLPWVMLSLAMALVLAFGISLWTSVPAMVARDVRFALTYALGFWLFLTPVLYPLPRTGKYSWLASLNPMTAVVNTFKHGMLGLDTLNLPDIGIAMGVIAVVLASGLWFFGRAETFAADKA